MVARSYFVDPNGLGFAPPPAKTAAVLATPQGIACAGLAERQQAAESVKHRQTSPVLAARLALEWTD
jgi:hypothetical protein